MIYLKNQKPPRVGVSGLAKTLPAESAAMIALLFATSTRAAIAALNVIAFGALGVVMVDIPAGLNRVPRRGFHWFEMVNDWRPLAPLYQNDS